MFCLVVASFVVFMVVWLPYLVVAAGLGFLSSVLLERFGDWLMQGVLI